MTQRRQLFDHSLKLVLVGDADVGKTCLLMSFMSEGFDPHQESTIGVDLKAKVMTIRGQRIKLTIWDTAGQDKFRRLTGSYYRGAQGIILVYDVTKEETFDSIKGWLEEANTFTTKDNIVKVLVGNKIDLQESRQIYRRDGSQFAKEHGMLFFEASAKTQQGVTDAFTELIEKILDSPSLLDSDDKKKIAPTTINLQKQEQKPKSNKCSSCVRI